MDPPPLEALHQHMQHHAAAQTAWWQEIDDAVDQAHHELELQRAGRDTNPPQVTSEHGPIERTATADTQQPSP